MTSYHTSLPGVTEARLETSETPLPLTATTLQSVLQPFILKKTDNKTNSESAVEILRRSYPYKLNPKTGKEERKRTIPYKINDDSNVTENMKNDEAKENSSARKTRKSEGQLLAIPYKMKKKTLLVNPLISQTFDRVKKVMFYTEILISKVDLPIRSLYFTHEKRL